MSDQIQDIFDCVVVSEMASGASTLVPLSVERVAEVTQGDENPLFATFVIESGWSKSKRYWPPEILASIAEQVNGASESVVGYMGHIKPEDEGFSFPDIQLQWLKASLQPSSDKTKLLVKGYVLPGAKGRDYLVRRLIRTISVSGNALLKRIQGGVAVSEFDLESIDLSRPRKAGMKTQLVALTSEMESGKVEANDIATLKESELRAHNPSLVKEIEEAVKKPLEEKVTEMETAVEEVKPTVDLLTEIREKLGVDEKGDLLGAIGEMLTKMKEAAKSMKDKVFDDVLEEKFKNADTRRLAKRLLVSEMNETSSDDDEDEDDEKYRTAVSEMIDKKVKEDDDLKVLVSSIEIGGGLSLGNKSNDRGTREVKDGYENDSIAVSKVGSGRR